MLKVFLRALRVLRSTSFFFTSSLGGLFRVRLTAVARAMAVRQSFTRRRKPDTTIGFIFSHALQACRCRADLKVRAASILSRRAYGVFSPLIMATKVAGSTTRFRLTAHFCAHARTLLR